MVDFFIYNIILTFLNVFINVVIIFQMEFYSAVNFQVFLIC